MSAEGDIHHISSRFRVESLNETIFISLVRVGRELEAWRHNHNYFRLHPSLGNKASAEIGTETSAYEGVSIRRFGRLGSAGSPDRRLESAGRRVRALAFTAARVDGSSTRTARGLDYAGP